MIAFSRILSLRHSFRFIQSAFTFHNLSSEFEPESLLLNLLELSIETHSLLLSQQSHARAHRLGLTQNLLIAQKLILSCCQFKCPFDAQLVFDSLSFKNTIICNTLLGGYGKNQIFHESAMLFLDMCNGSKLPSADDFTFSVIFKIVGDSAEVMMGKMVHGKGVKNGLVLDTVVGNSLMSMYGRCGCFDDSLKVFDEMPRRNVSSWNALISGYAKMNGECGHGAFGSERLWDIVKEIQNEGLKFDAFTVSTLLSLCREGSDKYGYGRELHSYTLKNGLDVNSRMDGDAHLGCCLIDMYSKNGIVEIAQRVFDRLSSKNVFVWTAMINGYVYCKKFDEALFLFREMIWRGGIIANKVSLIATLPAFSSSNGLVGVKKIHGYAVRRELNQDPSLSNALTDVYAKCGNLSYATRVFEHECVKKDAISWSSMISGYGLHGQGKKAVMLFDEMLRRGIKPDTGVVVGVLSACSRSGFIEDGMRIYDSVVMDYKMKPTVEMCGCMVDMLGRSGQLDRAFEFIKTMGVEPSPSIWGALVCACGIHGNDKMQELAYASLIEMEPENPGNYIWLSNLYAGSKRWDDVAKVRTVMRERGVRKLAGCSWISINSSSHSFFCCRQIASLLQFDLWDAGRSSFSNEVDMV